MESVSNYQVGAALWVVRAIDVRGVSVAALESAFHGAVTQGRFPRPDLDNALRLLTERDLLVFESGTVQHRTSVVPLLSLTDVEAQDLLTVLLRAASSDDPLADPDTNAVIGAAGEEAVAEWCIAELAALGYAALAKQVQRVSLTSDRFGYDVSAPVIGGATRRLEVKTTTSPASKTYRFFLSRNEFEVGRRNPRSWALVACRIHEDVATLVGWCRATELERYLPDDANGRWTEALVSLPVSALLPNAPSAVS